MPLILDAVDLLRGRFTRLRKGRSLERLEESVGINRNTLAAFVRGENVTQTTLQAIEAWCQGEETPHV